MIKKKIIPIFIVFLFGCTILPVNSANMGISNSDITGFNDTLITTAKDYTTAGYDFDKIVDPIFYEQEVLCEGHMPLLLDIETTKEFSLINKDKTDFLKSSEIGKTNIGKINYKYRILVKEDYSYIKIHYKEVPCNCSCATEKNFMQPGDLEKWDTQNITHSVIDYEETINTYRYVWKDIEHIDKIDFKKTNKIIVDIVGNFKASLVTQKIDIIPKIKIGDYTNDLTHLAWWNSNWGYKKNITIDNSKVSGAANLLNFPVYIKIDGDSDIGAHCQNDLDDIAFTNSAEDTQLKHEIETYSFAGNSLTAHLFVNVTSVSHDTNTTIFIYYGNAGAANQEDVNGTWNSNFQGVYHMDDSDGLCRDSTAGGNSGNYMGNLPTREAAQIGYGQNLDGVGDYANMPAGAFITGAGSVFAYANDDHAGADTKEIWYQADDDYSEYTYIGQAGGNGATNGYANAGEQWYIGMGAIAAPLTFYGLTFDTNDVEIWEDSTSQGTDSSADMPGGSYSMSYIGACCGGILTWHGKIDEVRLMNQRCTDGWVLTTYNTLESPSTFYSTGAEETAPLAEYENTRPVSNDLYPGNASTNIPISLGNWSVQITDADGNNTWGNFSVVPTGVMNYGTQWNNTGNGTREVNLSTLAYNTQYKVYVNFSDNATHSVDNWFMFTTENTPYVNYAPTSNDLYPGNGSTGILVSLGNFSIQIIDINGNITGGNFSVVPTGYMNYGTQWNNTGNGTREVNLSTLAYGVEYTVYVNFSDDYMIGTDEVNNWFTFTTETAANTAPSITAMEPANGTTNQLRLLQLSATVNDKQGNAFNLSWYSNSSGSWLMFAQNDTCSNGTFKQINSNFSEANTTYYWNITAEDGQSENQYNSSGIYHFTTLESARDPSNLSAPIVTGVSPTDTTINLTWDKGANATHTRIQTNIGAYPSSIFDGTNVYNDTGSATDATSLSEGTLHYFKAWSFNSTFNEWSSGNDTVTRYTYPGATTSFTVTAINQTILNLTWVKGAGAEITNISYRTDYYPVNYTNGTSAYNDVGSATDVTGLNPGTLYYFRAWGYDTSSKWFSLTNESELESTSCTPSNVTNFHVNVSTGTVLNLSWTNGNGTNTIIRYKNSSYISGTSDGILLLNDTTSLTTYQHTSLNYSSKHYYRIWSYNAGVYCLGNQSALNYTRPQTPQNATGTLYGAVALNITWDGATGGDNVTIIKRTGAYPQNVTNGTVLCNLSNLIEFYNTTHTDGDYYSMFSWNSTTNLYSVMHELLWGGLQINVYDENTSAALTWNIFITNASGSETKEYTSKTNPTSLDINEIPHGTNTALILSATGYKSRTYYMDLMPNDQYIVNAYLPSNNDSELYLITVNNDYDSPVETAKITFKRSIGGVYVNVSTMLTDANGQVNLYLIPDKLYKVEISKTGFDTGYSDYTPSSSIFIHTFKIYFTEGSYANASGCNEAITFEGVKQGGILTLWYNDTKALTTNTQIYVYEFNYSTLLNTLVTSFSNVSNNTIKVTVSVNSTNPHYVYLYYNHSICEFQKLTLFFSGKWGNASDGEGITNESRFNAIFDNYGINPFGWSNTIVFIILVGILFSLGERNTGVALIASGVIGLFLVVVLFGGMTDLRDTIPILIIILGILVQWRNNQKEGGL